jgi:hypothetical protein
MATELTRSMEPATLKPWHKTLTDIMLASPELTQREIAKRLGKTEMWLSIVINSDAFQHYIALRREELHSPVVVARFEDKIAAVGSMAIDRIGERLETRAPMTNDELLAAATFAAKCAGLGTPKPGAGVNLYVVNTPGPAATSAQWAEMAGGKVTDISPKE